MTNIELPNTHVPHYPLYSIERDFIRILNGQSRRVLLSMREQIWKHVGTPQENQDWSNPDEWIPLRLKGEECNLAQMLWEASEQKINPRHIVGEWLLCSSYGLLEYDSHERFYVTDMGQNFLDNPFGETERQIDYSEGLLHLLASVAEHGPAKRAELLPYFTSFLETYSQVRSQASIGSYWYSRISNLVDRGLVQRSGVTYQITSNGLAYLESIAPLIESKEGDSVEEPLNDIRKLVSEQSDEVRQKMADTLAKINPYQLEFLIQRLLEAIGYENVIVTNKSGDGGVDVVADIEVGITLVREVVQVKRRQGTLGRPILDQLRGSLHRFDATRGTIITTGKFSRDAQKSAFERGAAPITLIDGERLIDLLIEHKIGVRKRPIEVLEFILSDFSSEENQ